MPSIEDLLNQAAKKTDDELANELSSLTTLNNKEIISLLNEGVKQKEILQLMKVLSDATKSNRDKAEAINKIEGASLVVVQLLKRVI